jgi:hypothetical protein
LDFHELGTVIPEIDTWRVAKCSATYGGQAAMTSRNAESDGTKK